MAKYERTRGLRGARRFIRSGTSSIKSLSQALKKQTRAKGYLDIAEKIQKQYKQLYRGAFKKTMLNSVNSIAEALQTSLSDIQTTISVYSKKGRSSKGFTVGEETDFSRYVNSNVRVDIVDVYKGLGDDKDALSSVMADPTVQKVMNDILHEAQDLAPIDKRYIGNYLSGKQKGAKIRQMSLSMPVLEKSKYGLRSQSGRAFGSVRAVREMTYNNKQIHLGGEKDDTVLSREKQRYIQSLSKEDRRLMWFKEGKSDSAKGAIFLSRMKRNKFKEGNIGYKGHHRIATLFNDGQHHGGEEELRRSGRFSKLYGIISFNPTRLGTDYDYSLEQHENTTYKHAAGKSAFFLLKAYSRNKMRLIDAVKKALGEK